MVWGRGYLTFQPATSDLRTGPASAWKTLAHPRFFLSCFLLCLLQPVQADLPVASSLEAYYREAARLQRGPQAKSYLTSYRLVHEYAWPDQGLSEERLADGVCREVDLMLESLDIDPLLAGYGLHRDLSYPAAIAPRLQGRVAESVVWLAACHGLAGSSGDPWSGFFSPEEYDGMLCGRYVGPPIHPGTATSPISGANPGL